MINNQYFIILRRQTYGKKIWRSKSCTFPIDELKIKVIFISVSCVCECFKCIQFFFVAYDSSVWEGLLKAIDVWIASFNEKLFFV